MLGPELSGDLPCRWWVILSEELLQSFDHGCVALRPEHSAQVFFAGRSAVGGDLGKPVALGGGVQGAPTGVGRVLGGHTQAGGDKGPGDSLDVHDVGTERAGQVAHT